MKEQSTDTAATDMNARLRLRRTTTPADLTERLFGTPEPVPDDDQPATDTDDTGPETAA